ncbi:hypothetical protein [Bradyrhizobium sp. HKCCYLR1023]|uniref:hypothetical protein n=1 Tax=Bradyrhizobium TaxID=374 RepID=UPI003EBDCCD4
MPPKVKTLVHAEMIRDGGSLAAEFLDDRDVEWILFLPLRQVNQEGRMERLGFDEPVLIDASPDKRPAGTPGITYSKLSGPSYPLSWAQAQELTAQFARCSSTLNERAASSLTKLCFAIGHDGKLPQDMERFLPARRQS